MPKRNTLAIALLFLTLGSTAVAAESTINYFQFYPALAKLQLDLVSVQWNGNETNLDILATFTLKNPTVYRGLSLKAFEGEYQIQEYNSTVKMRQDSLPHVSAKQLLGPVSTVTVTVPFRTIPDTARGVAEIQNRGGVVQFMFSIELVLSTFLDKYSVVSGSYECENHSGRGGCEQISITLSTSREQGGGGGGGGGV